MATKTSSEQISLLAQTIGTDIKQLLATVGDTSKLTTTAKASLVVAINELKASFNSVDLSKIIDDAQTTTKLTWSSTKINVAINAAVAALVNGAPEALDTLKELSDAITTNKDAIEALQSIADGHVKFNAAQSLTTEQKTQARTNIDAASTTEVAAAKKAGDDAQATANTNKTSIGTMANLKTTAKSSLVEAVNEVKGVADTAKTAAATADSKAVAAKSAADAAQKAAEDLAAAVGDTDTDYVAVYEAARNGTVS
jgi:hypothetical protein|nr:MAG TPA: hypothetical protein [Caudoviricetes sp.]